MKIVLPESRVWQLKYGDSSRVNTLPKVKSQAIDKRAKGRK